MPMDREQEEFLRELLADFRVEAAEHYQKISQGLVDLEKSPAQPRRDELIEITFREIHSLKGSARAVNLLEIERICQAMEGVFHQIKSGTLDFSPFLFEALFRAADVLRLLLPESDLPVKQPNILQLAPVLKQLEMAVMEGRRSTTPGTVAPLSGPTIPSSATVQEIKPTRTKESLENVLNLADNSVLNPNTASVWSPAGSRALAQETVRVATGKLQHVLNLAEEFIVFKSALAHQIGRMGEIRQPGMISLKRDMDQLYKTFSRQIDDLVYAVKNTLVFPFSTILEIIPRVVRDLGKEFQKEVLLSVSGSEIEIDRRILEELKDPLIHLIRNAIDHGIELPSKRVEKGKSASGNLMVSVIHESPTRVVLEISDDGAGIDTEKVRAAVIKQGVLAAEVVEKMDDHEINNLIFRSGVSTSPFITDISGRGLGMAIVAEKVTRLGGVITVDAVQGKGTTFNISLPVTLATFRGVKVGVGDQTFIIPVSAVQRVLRIRPQEMKTVESKHYIYLDGQNIGLIKLSDVLGIYSGKPGRPLPEMMLVVLVSVANSKTGFIVDAIFGEQEGMVKSLGPQLLNVKKISGVIITGNGSVVPILNVPELFETTSDSNGYGEQRVLLPEDTPVSEQKYILVAEDSITLRSLLRNILEGAGYKVRTAVDGLEAYQYLVSDHFDLLVSDVEMPVMNGFDLTVKIRGEKHLADIPVILVTALDTHEDRQKGMEAGANAYIVKGSFEQSNLLDTIRRLI